MNVDQTMRRMAVSNVIEFAKLSGYASWELVSVDEQEKVTIVEFQLVYPMRDTGGRVVERVFIAISTGRKTPPDGASN